MRNVRVMLPLIAILVAVFIFAGYRYQKHRRYVVAQTNLLAHDLVTKKNSPLLFQMGTIFKKELSRVLAEPTQIILVKYGDEPAPIGDGSACSRLVLSNRVGQLIGVRLQHDSKSKKFYVWGFWKPQ